MPEIKAEDYITNWHGKPLGDLTRGQLIDALDWCVKELRKHNEEYQHRSRVPVQPASHVITTDEGRRPVGDC